MKELQCLDVIEVHGYLLLGMGMSSSIYRKSAETLAILRFAEA